MSETYAVVAGNAHYGPFETREQAVAWADHPDRTFVAFRVEPLFGGIAITDEGEPVQTAELPVTLTVTDTRRAIRWLVEHGREGGIVAVDDDYAEAEWDEVRS